MVSFKNSKKGFSLAQLPQIALLFGLGIVIMAIMADVVTNYRGTISRSTATIQNESITITIGTLTGLGNDYVTNINYVLVANESGYRMNSGEYKLFNTGSENSQLNISNASKTNTAFAVNYTYYTAGTSFNISGKGLQGYSKIGSWYPTIGTVIGAAVIITALFFLFKKKND